VRWLWAFLLLLLGCSMAGRSGGKFINGVIEYAGANTPGWVSNLGISLSAGTFSIVDAQGTALSSNPENVGWVTAPSTTAGQYVTLKVTSGGTFIDDAGASNIIGELFGVTTSIAWAQDMPFFLYVANRANSDIDGVDGSSVFFISRDPRMSTTPASADDIGDTGAVSVNKTQDSIFILQDVTIANYTSLPCQVIGAIRMQMSASDDWTVQALGNTDGIGKAQLEKTFGTLWTFPKNQNGANASSYLITSGTAPAFGVESYYYSINSSGIVNTWTDLQNDGGQVGVGANAISLSIPYELESSVFGSIFPIIGGARISCQNGAEDRFVNAWGSGDQANFKAPVVTSGQLDDSLEFILASDFIAGTRSISAGLTYKAF